MSKATEKARKDTLTEVWLLVSGMAEAEESAAANYGVQGRAREGEDAFTRSRMAKGVAERVALLMEPEDAPDEEKVRADE